MTIKGIEIIFMIKGTYIAIKVKLMDLTGVYKYIISTTLSERSFRFLDPL